MRRRHRSRKLLALFLLTQLVVGYGGWFTAQHEIFPFTSWLLFVLVPDQVTDYDILIHGPGSQPPDPPLPFSQSGTLVRAPHSITSYQLVQQLGMAVRKGDASRVASLRSRLEEQFTVSHLPYDLVRVTYRPLARWKTGRVISRLTLQSFVATTPPLSNPELSQPE